MPRPATTASEAAELAVPPLTHWTICRPGDSGNCPSMTPGATTAVSLPRRTTTLAWVSLLIVTTAPLSSSATRGVLNAARRVLFFEKVTTTAT